MLDKERNHLISHAFRKANITSIESEPTEAEIDDAAHHLNSMLQSWNNDGFRLFKIKTGYMPFIPKVNEYALATQAYKSFEPVNILKIEKIGATKIIPKNYNDESLSMVDMAPGQKLIVADNVKTPINTIVDVDYEKHIVTLAQPLEFSVYKNSTVFYGTFNTALTEIQVMPGAFNYLPFSEYTIPPVIGDIIYFCYNGTWIKKKIIGIDSVNHVLTFSGDLISGGKITNQLIVFGSSLYQTNLAEDYTVKSRRCIVDKITEIPEFIAIPTENDLGEIFKVESCDLDAKTIILEPSEKQEELTKLGEPFINANQKYVTQKEVLWNDFTGVEGLVDALDWGSVADTDDLEADDWGYVTDTASTLLDWGTLTGTANIIGYSESAGVKYVLVQDTSDDDTYLLYDTGNGWQTIELEGYGFEGMSLFTYNNTSYLYDIAQGLYILNQDIITSVYTVIGIEKIIQYMNKYYLISPKAEGTTNRSVVATSDFVTFEPVYTVVLDSLENPVEFQQRMFIGSTDTYAGDMKDFINIDVYSQNRCVVGDRMLNLNTLRVCSYTKDGVNFYPMPMMLSNQTAWGMKDGCAFIAVYGILNGSIVSTQIFTANDFNPVWTPQVIVPGRVFDIFFDDNKAYFVSDVAVYSLFYNSGVKSTGEIKTFLLGAQICRPQQVMNVMKYGFNNQVELPMNPLSLQEYTVLPRSGLGGEPVNYCFFRDAKDGKMMVWGTPSKFGEYLKFSYVEPLTLLEDARCTPDFPDEYYEAVEDGLAAELGLVYGLPVERQQALVAKAEASKENAMLHDNEDTSYNIMPNQRWG